VMVDEIAAVMVNEIAAVMDKVDEQPYAYDPAGDSNRIDISAIFDVPPRTDDHSLDRSSAFRSSDGAAIEQPKSIGNSRSKQVKNSSPNEPFVYYPEIEKVSVGTESKPIYENDAAIHRETTIVTHIPSLDSISSNNVIPEADDNNPFLYKQASETILVEINKNEVLAIAASSDLDDFIQNDDDMSSFSPDRTLRSRNVSFEYLYNVFSDTASDKQETSPITSTWHRKRAVSSPAVTIGGLQHLRSARALTTRTFQSPNLQKNNNDEQHLLNFDAVDTLEMLDTLSRPFVRYRELSTRQDINAALRNIRINGETVEEIAVTKVQVWWRLVYPRKKLMKRIHARDLCKDIAYSCAEDAINIVTIKRAKRRRMLRVGACLTIQRYFRKFRFDSMGSLRNVRLKKRSDRAWYLLEIWRRAAAAGVHIYRYLRYLKLKRIIKAKIAGKKGFLLRRTVANYIHALTLHKKLEFQKRFLERTDTTTVSIGRSNFYKERQNAAIMIQKYYRRYSIILTMLNRKVKNVMYSKVTYFFIRFVARRRVRLRMKREQSAKLIQKLYRGFVARKYVLDIVTSGLILKYMWKKHQSYKSLKSQLRRIDRPYTITMYGIRNLQRSTLNSKQLKFKISIWWHPLLHIVSRSDVDVIVNSKQPQLIYTSSLFEVQNEEVDNKSRRTSIAEGFRMIGSSLLSAPTIVGRSNPLSLHSSTPKTSRSNAVSLRPLNGMTIGPPINKNVPLTAENLLSSGRVPAAATTAITPVATPTVTPTVTPAVTPAATTAGAASAVGRNRSSSVLSIDALPSRMIQKKASGTKELVEDSEEEDEDDDEYNVDEDVQVKTEALKARRSFLFKRMMESHAAYHEVPSNSFNNGSVINNSNDNKSINNYATTTLIQNKAVEITDTTAKKKTADTTKMPDVSQVYRKRPSSILGRLTIMRNPRVTNWDSKLLCSFENQVIKIPGCHGNSVIKFDIIDGE